MRVLVLGSGGREHALCWRLAQSPRLERLFALPGNAGTESIATNLPGDPCDAARVIELARRERIDLVVVGPEDPLAGGIVDALQAAGIRAFGPTAAGARLEADKAFAKQLMRQHAVPTAEARVFEDYEHARDFIASREGALVVKAAGLAKGKGVILCNEPAAAILVAEQMLKERKFGDAGARILIEERLEGREVSVLALIDGRTIYVLEAAQDHKRLLDEDLGPNTGGMGAFSPAPLDTATQREIEASIFVPVLDALVREGIPYRGVLYAGLMLTPGGPKVLEFNCRFGDPEAQALLMRLDCDLLHVLDLCVDGRLDEAEIRWRPQPSLCVVMASGGYPDEARTGFPITGIPELPLGGDVAVFHAGVRRRGGKLITAGGRVLGVTALGDTLEDARRRAYEVVERISFEGATYRRDIGRV